MVNRKPFYAYNTPPQARCPLCGNYIKPSKSYYEVMKESRHKKVSKYKRDGWVPTKGGFQRDVYNTDGRRRDIYSALRQQRNYEMNRIG